jgi:glutamine amidotransferase
MAMIAVIDYGMGNLHSVAKALEHVAPNQSVVVTHDQQLLRAADRVVLPGVGAIRDCMQAMNDAGVAQLIPELARTRPFLGVCVGMQALLEHSAENNGVDTLGLFPGQVVRFNEGQHDASGRPMKVPHMGWSQVNKTLDHPLWHGIDDASRFYFVHSYYAALSADLPVAGQCHYQVDFAAAIAQNYVFATQFHPEKSAQAGLQLYQNFTRWQGH